MFFYSLCVELRGSFDPCGFLARSYFSGVRKECLESVGLFLCFCFRTIFLLHFCVRWKFIAYSAIRVMFSKFLLHIQNRTYTFVSLYFFNKIKSSKLSTSAPIQNKNRTTLTWHPNNKTTRYRTFWATRAPEQERSNQRNSKSILLKRRSCT